MIKNKEKRERRKKTVPIWIGILVFIGAFIIGILSKLLIQPSWMADYSMKWSEKIGIVKTVLEIILMTPTIPLDLVSMVIKPIMEECAIALAVKQTVEARLYVMKT